MEQIDNKEDKMEDKIDDQIDDKIEDIADKDSNPELSRRDVIYIITYLVFSVLFIILVNGYFFSNNKVSHIDNSDVDSVVYPSQEEAMQIFSAPSEKTVGVTLYMVVDEADDSAVFVYLTDKNGTIMGQWLVHSSEIVDGKYYLDVRALDLEQGEQYCLIAQTEGESSIGLLSTESSDYGYGSIGMNGKNWLYSIEYSAFSMNIISLEIVLIITGLILFLLYKKKAKSIHFFSILFAVSAVIFFIITPYNSLFDEEGHFLRAYEISKGHMLSGKFENGSGRSEVPEELYNGVTNVTKSLNPSQGAMFLYARQSELSAVSVDGNIISAENPNQALYSPASYIPQSIGLFVGGLITKNALIFYGFGRAFALIVNVILIILAMKMLPERRMLILAVALNPIFMAQMISYSADGNLNSISIFYVAYILFLRNKDSISIGHKLLLIALSLIIALSKVVYFPFVLLIFLLSDQSFKNKTGARVFKYSLVIAAACVAVAWFAIARSYLFDDLAYGVRPDDQFKYLLSHFYMTPQIAFNTFITFVLDWIVQLFGGIFGKGWLNYKHIVWIVFGIIVCVEFFTKRSMVIDGNTETSEELKESKVVLSEKKLSRRDKIIIGIVLFMIIGLTFASLYVQWTPYMADYVKGIQGRYFIPLILPASLLVRRKIINGNPVKRTAVEMLGLIMILIFAVVNTIQTFV